MLLIAYLSTSILIFFILGIIWTRNSWANAIIKIVLLIGSVTGLLTLLIQLGVVMVLQ